MTTQTRQIPEEDMERAKALARKLIDLCAEENLGVAALALAQVTATMCLLGGRYDKIEALKGLSHFRDSVATYVTKADTENLANATE